MADKVMTETQTRYVVIVRYPSGQESAHSFDSMLERAIFMISLSLYAVVVREYVDSGEVQ